MTYVLGADAMAPLSHIVDCDLPDGSMLSRELIERAYFYDSYRMPLSNREIGIVDVFFGIFSHYPKSVTCGVALSGRIGGLGRYGKRSERVDRSPCG